MGGQVVALGHSSQQVDACLSTDRTMRVEQSTEAATDHPFHLIGVLPSHDLSVLDFVTAAWRDQALVDGWEVGVN